MVFRSDFEVLMEVLLIFYTFNSMNVTTLMRKSNINSKRKNDIIDLMLAKELLMINNNNFLFLTPKGETVASNIAPAYKKLKEFFFNNNFNF